MYDGTEPIAGKTYSDAWWAGWVAKQTSGVSRDDIFGYLDEQNIDFTSAEYDFFSTSITDPKMISDFTAAKVDAQKTGNQKLLNTLDVIFKYGEKGIAALVQAGVLNGPSLARAGYSNVSQDPVSGQIRIGQGVGAAPVPVQGAPLQQPKVFGLDFSSPTVIVVTFVIVMAAIYFLFFYGKGNKKK